MRAVVQRVTQAKVEVDTNLISTIGEGLLVFLGVGGEDDYNDVDYLVDKCLHLRIFEDEHGKMNRSLVDVGGEMLVVSQFTLFGDCRKGRRPSFEAAADPETAKELYSRFIDQAKEKGIIARTGAFRSFMKVSLVNNGPVTLLVDSKKAF
ncbi:MAG: D-tyrosyl-tRNA(Tyr) deacylase [Deltaproteobacteria bacterium]|nr:D-tyrosyl-tRNA(Tyr) deacylase [Deltaproteobacteria bacterium]